MDMMSKVWGVVVGLWATFLAALVYFEVLAAPILVVVALWAIMALFPGTFISFVICEKRGWV